MTKDAPPSPGLQTHEKKSTPIVAVPGDPCVSFPKAKYGTTPGLYVKVPVLLDEDPEIGAKE